MKNEEVKVRIQIPITFDKPNRNGSMITKEAIENAFNNSAKNAPIIYKDKEGKLQDVVIGNITDSVASWDFENQVCIMTIEGIVYHVGARVIINKIEDGKISDFTIHSIGLTT